MSSIKKLEQAGICNFMYYQSGEEFNENTGDSKFLKYLRLTIAQSIKKKKDRLEVRTMEDILRADIRAEKIAARATTPKKKKIKWFDSVDYVNPDNIIADLMLWPDAPTFILPPKQVTLPQAIEMVTPEFLIKLQEKSLARHNADIETSNVLRIEDILFFDGIHIPSVKSVFTQHGNLKPIENVRRPTGTVTGRPKLKRPETNPIKLRPIPPPAKKKKPFATIDLNKLAAYAQTPAAGGGFIDGELPKDWKRPAAVYSNLPSPYGIATQMLADKLKEDLERRIG